MAVAMKGMEAIRIFFRDCGASASQKNGRGKNDSGGEEDNDESREGATEEAEGSRVEEERKGEYYDKGKTFAEQVREYMKGDGDKFDEACR